MTRLFHKVFLSVSALLVAGGALLADLPANLGSVTGASGRAGKTSLFGDYLAARFAGNSRDTEAAAEYYARALDKDPGNDVLLERAFLLEVTSGNWPRARALGKRLIKVEPTHRISRILLGIDAFKRGRYRAAHKHFSVTGKGPIAELTAVLGQAWSRQALGNSKGARKSLKLLEHAEWSEFYRQYHGALIADVAGQKKRAAALYGRAFDRDKRALRVTLSFASLRARTGMRKNAASILDTYRKKEKDHPLVIAALKAIKAGGKPVRPVPNAKAGLAEVFFGIGEALVHEGSIDLGAIYLQMALHIRPDIDLARLTLANVYESTKKYGKAIEHYEKVPADSPLKINADVEMALNLDSLERVDEAKALLEKAIAKYPQSLEPIAALGNILRGRKRYKEAAAIYSKAIAQIEKAVKKHWSLYYSRGICHERTKAWAKAEADLQQAMKLYPNQPLVLNYLGYSWIDQNVHLKEGMDLIRRAVKLRPDDGYIVDSLGWAYFRLGEHKKAVGHLERAVELRPEDPVINDHLGDAYWRAGRHLEAKFQWSHAKALKPEAKVLAIIEDKLANGMAEIEENLAAKPKKSNGG